MTSLLEAVTARAAKVRAGTEADGTSDPRQIAARLGVPVSSVRGLQERGILVHFDLTDLDVRELLWQAHVRSRLLVGRRRHAAGIRETSSSSDGVAK